MNKFTTWILNHLKLVLGIVTFTVTFVVIGVVMLSSYNSYQDYEKRYNATDLEVRSAAAASPNRIEFEDDYVTYNNDGSVKSTKSSYKNSFTAWAEDLKVTSSSSEKLVVGDSLLNSYIPNLSAGGKIALNLTLSEKSFVDIDFVISSDVESQTDEGTVYGVKDLLSSVTFSINGENMEETIDIVSDGPGLNWQHLVMAGFALPAGDLTIEIQSQSNKSKLMPAVRNITVIANADVAFAA